MSNIDVVALRAWAKKKNKMQNKFSGHIVRNSIHFINKKKILWRNGTMKAKHLPVEYSCAYNLVEKNEKNMKNEIIC